MSIELKELLRDFNLSQKQAGDMLGIGYSSVNKYINNGLSAKPMLRLAIGHLRTLLSSDRYKAILKERDEIDSEIARLVSRKKRLMDELVPGCL